MRLLIFGNLACKVHPRLFEAEIFIDDNTLFNFSRNLLPVLYILE